MTNMLTVEEVQEKLKLKRSKTYQLIKTPGFPSIIVGERTIRVPEDELEKWIRNYTGKKFELIK